MKKLILLVLCAACITAMTQASLTTKVREAGRSPQGAVRGTYIIPLEIHSALHDVLKKAEMATKF